MVKTAASFNDLEGEYLVLANRMSMIERKQDKIRGVKHINKSKVMRRFGLDNMCLWPERDAFRHVLDHCRAENIYGVDYLIGEPYEIYQDDLIAVMRKCIELGLNFHVGGGSKHYPNRTIRFFITKDVNRTTSKEGDANNA